ncbi:MAG: hypothetical protein WA876_12570 [Candidatus Acidiferrales bacterium]
MPTSKENARRKPKRGEPADKSPRRMNAADQAIIEAVSELQEPAQPRPRMRLRAAMRKAGLDEWKIAWLLNFKIHCLAESKKSSDNKLLLDYLKEAARHLDPVSLRTAAQETSAIEIVHDVPRPIRNEAPGE